MFLSMPERLEISLNEMSLQYAIWPGMLVKCLILSVPSSLYRFIGRQLEGRPMVKAFCFCVVHKFQNYWELARLTPVHEFLQQILKIVKPKWKEMKKFGFHYQLILWKYFILLMDIIPINQNKAEL